VNTRSTVTWTSHSHDGSLAASWQRSTISATSASTAASLSERASASNQQCSATTFVPPTPPAMVPTLAVVSSSIRPCGISAMALAAATIALRPASGRMPAWAAAPRKAACRR